MQETSAFPKFADGDVYIVISASRIFKLHSHTLGRLSPYFKHQFESTPGAKLTLAARREGACAYRFELNTYLPEQFGKFIRIRVNDNGKPQRDHLNLPDIETAHAMGLGMDQENRIWDWLFGSFYGISPKFEDHNLATVLHSCMSLVDAADSIGSIDHVREIVDLALLRQDQVLWKSVAANPAAWTELACRVHSQSIFKEGIIHLVGLWPRTSEHDRRDLRSEIYLLCEKKHRELELLKQIIDIRILGHYPSFLCRSHIDKPQRTSYSSDIYMWMSVSFFRQFYAQAIAECRTRHAPDGGYKFYQAIMQGGTTYLTHEDFQTFYQFFPMSSKACNVLEANMNVLKDEVKVFVQDLMVSHVHVKSDEFVVEWLTCANVEKKDLPWEVDEQEQGQGQEQSGDGDDIANSVAGMQTGMEIESGPSRSFSELMTTTTNTNRQGSTIPGIVGGNGLIHGSDIDKNLSNAILQHEYIDGHDIDTDNENDNDADDDDDNDDNEIDEQYIPEDLMIQQQHAQYRSSGYEAWDSINQPPIVGGLYSTESAGYKVDEQGKAKSRARIKTGTKSGVENGNGNTSGKGKDKEKANGNRNQKGKEKEKESGSGKGKGKAKAKATATTKAR